MSALTNVFDYLLPDSDSEVKRQFTKIYVENEYRRYRALGIGDHDIIKFFQVCQKSDADPVLDDIYLIANKTSINNNWVTIGAIVYSQNFYKRKSFEIMRARGINNNWPKSIQEVADYFNAETGESKPTLRSVATITLNGETYEYTAWYPEYVQLTKEGKPRSSWKKPYIMLKKCSEVGLMRSLFPEVIRGYTEDELGYMYSDDAIEAEIVKAKAVEEGLAKIENEERVLERAEHSKEISEVVEAINVLISKVKTKTLTEKVEVLKKINVKNVNELPKKTLSELLLNKAILEGMIKKQDEITLTSKGISPLSENDIVDASYTEIPLQEQQELKEESIDIKTEAAQSETLYEFNITGDTKTHKVMLKNLGGRYNSPRTSWDFTGATLDILDKVKNIHGLKVNDVKASVNG